LRLVVDVAAVLAFFAGLAGMSVIGLIAQVAMFIVVVGLWEEVATNSSSFFSLVK